MQFEIPVVLPNGELSKQQVVRAEATEAEKRLYDEVSDAVVKIVTPRGSGSGFFVDKDGHVVSAAHVVVDVQEVFVVTRQGKKYRARITDLDDITDLVKLKLEDFADTKQKFLTLANSSTLERGDPVYALGHPHGRKEVHLSPGLYTGQGIVYDIADRSKVAEKYKRSASQAEQQDWIDVLAQPLLHADSTIAGGSSGGPLVNAEGKVVGVASIGGGKPRTGSFYRPVEDVYALSAASNRKFDFVYRSAAAFSFEGALRKSINRYMTDSTRYACGTPRASELKCALSNAVNGAAVLGTLASRFGLPAAAGILAAAGGVRGLASKPVPERIILTGIHRRGADKRPLFQIDALPLR